MTAGPTPGLFTGSENTQMTQQKGRAPELHRLFIGETVIGLDRIRVS